ncbi:hypothetical protein PYCC9005_005104 [Savitreella phatthalungensis]
MSLLLLQLRTSVTQEVSEDVFALARDHLLGKSDEDARFVEHFAADDEVFDRLVEGDTKAVWEVVFAAVAVADAKQAVRAQNGAERVLESGGPAARALARAVLLMASDDAKDDPALALAFGARRTDRQLLEKAALGNAYNRIIEDLESLTGSPCLSKARALWLVPWLDSLHYFSPSLLQFSMAERLVRSENAARRMWAHDNFGSLWTLARQHFPHESEPLLFLLQASAYAIDYLSRELSTVETLTQTLPLGTSVSELLLTVDVENSVVELTRVLDVQSFPGGVLTIPKGSRGIIKSYESDRPVVLWQFEYSPLAYLFRAIDSRAQPRQEILKLLATLIGATQDLQVVCELLGTDLHGLQAVAISSLDIDLLLALVQSDMPLEWSSIEAVFASTRQDISKLALSLSWKMSAAMLGEVRDPSLLALAVPMADWLAGSLSYTDDARLLDVAIRLLRLGGEPRRMMLEALAGDGLVLATMLRKGLPLTRILEAVLPYVGDVHVYFSELLRLEIRGKVFRASVEFASSHLWLSKLDLAKFLERELDWRAIVAVLKYGGARLSLALVTAGDMALSRRISDTLMQSSAWETRSLALIALRIAVGWGIENSFASDVWVKVRSLSVAPDLSTAGLRDERLTVENAYRLRCVGLAAEVCALRRDITEEVLDGIRAEHLSIRFYRPSLHGNLSRNIAQKYKGLELARLVKPFPMEFGPDYIYDMAFAEEILRANNFVHEVGIANLNLSMLEAQREMLRGLSLLILGGLVAGRCRDAAARTCVRALMVDTSGEPQSETSGLLRARLGAAAARWNTTSRQELAAAAVELLRRDMLDMPLGVLTTLMQLLVSCKESLPDGIVSTVVGPVFRICMSQSRPPLEILQLLTAVAQAAGAKDAELAENCVSVLGRVRDAADPGAPLRMLDSLLAMALAVLDENASSAVSLARCLAGIQVDLEASAEGRQIYTRRILPLALQLLSTRSTTLALEVGSILMAAYGPSVEETVRYWCSPDSTCRQRRAAAGACGRPRGPHSPSEDDENEIVLRQLDVDDRANASTFR